MMDDSLRSDLYVQRRFVPEQTGLLSPRVEDYVDATNPMRAIDTALPMN